MKKSILAFCMLAGLTACSTMEESQPQAQDNHDASVLLSQKRSPEEAKACALQAFSDFYGMSRSVVMIKDVQCVTSMGKSRSTEGDTLYYVVNTEDNAGYAVISADRRIDPVLAVTEKGNVEDVENVDNPGAALYFNALADYIDLNPNIKPIDSTTIIKPMYPIDMDHKTETITSQSIKGPNAPYEWGQSFPENYYFPNGYAGCGNIASMLVMSCFEEPKTYSRPTGTNFVVDWSVIKQHTVSAGWTDECGEGMSASSHKAIAELCWAIAEQNKSSYEEKGTPTYIGDVHDMFIRCVSGLNVSDIKNGIPKPLISSNEMIYVRATAEPEGGHAFVIDGVLTNYTTTRELERDKNTGNWNVISSNTTYTDYNHINWGWQGLDNGYFSLNVFDTTTAYKYDGDSSKYTADFTTDFRYFTVTRR